MGVMYVALVLFYYLKSTLQHFGITMHNSTALWTVQVRRTQTQHLNKVFGYDQS